MKHLISAAIGLALGLAYHFGKLYHDALTDVRHAVDIHLDSHRAEHAEHTANFPATPTDATVDDQKEG